MELIRVGLRNNNDFSVVEKTNLFLSNVHILHESIHEYNECNEYKISDLQRYVYIANKMVNIVHILMSMTYPVVCMSVYMYVYAWVYVCIYIYVYMYMYINICM